MFRARFFLRLGWLGLLVSFGGLGGDGGFFGGKLYGAETAGDLPLMPYKFLDPATFVEWADGKEQLIVPLNAKDEQHHPGWVFGSDGRSLGPNGLTFGDTKTPGVRHLRIGLKAPQRVGAVLVRGGGVLSVLRPEAAYPGHLDDDKSWIPAQRLVDGKLSQAEVGKDEYAIWVLPEVMGEVKGVRAFRFSHTAAVADHEYAGWLGGAFIIGDRMISLSPQAAVSARLNDQEVGLINNGKAEVWEAWSNLVLEKNDPVAEAAVPVVSAENAEWLILSWPAPVRLRALALLWAGFSQGDVQTYEGSEEVHPREAPESAWKAVKSFPELRNRFGSSLGVDWLDFGKEITTRALRLRMTAAINDNNFEQLHGKAKGGRRVWLGEVLALQNLGLADLKTAERSMESGEKPPIPIHFNLPEAGWVTLVIDDAKGVRVRNLVSEMPFPKGDNTVWWDGSNDLARDTEIVRQGVYFLPTQLIEAGRYNVRGIYRKQVDVKTEFGFYTGGNPPWNTLDKSGGWLANQTPPSAIQFVPDEGSGKPAILVGSYFSQGTAGLAWLDLKGHKMRGENSLGGHWTGAQYLAQDHGRGAEAAHVAYAGAVWGDPRAEGAKSKEARGGEVRITAIGPKTDKLAFLYKFIAPPALVDSQSKEERWGPQLGGMAVHNGVVVFSLTALDKLVFADVATGKLIGELGMDQPGGLAFDSHGRLHAVSGKRLLRFLAGTDPKRFSVPEAVINDLDQAQGLMLDSQDRIFVSIWGDSHQVKIYSSAGRLERAIGKAGVPKAGPYDPLHMNHPRGMTLDSSNRLWVAEEDFQPKRVSVWNLDGSLVGGLYGPTQYGGGGQIDGQDKTRLYYDGMEFKLDWTRGGDQLVNVFYRKDAENQLELAFRSGPPETAIYVQGRRYWTNCFNSNPTNGAGTAFIFADRNGIAVPVAAAGQVSHWDLLKTEPFLHLWPEGTKPFGQKAGDQDALFIWSDHNADGQVQANEVNLEKGVARGVTVARDLSFLIARFNDRAMRYAPRQLTAEGVPQYEFTYSAILAEGAQEAPSSGGAQVLLLPGGWTVHTTATAPFHPYGISGGRNGQVVWSYPSLWPGLHASHAAAQPDRTGMLIGHTRLLGDAVVPIPGEPMWMLNTNQGPIVVFTADGLWVTQLFNDARGGEPWAMPLFQRGAVVTELTVGEENFWPSVTQTADGQIYLVSGRNNCVARIDGLETMKRLPNQPLEVTAEDLERARNYFLRSEALRQAAKGRAMLNVVLRSEGPKVDGRVSDWPANAWVDIDKSGGTGSKAKGFNVSGSVTISGDRLYAAWRTGDRELIKNEGAVTNAMFRTGGGLDLMIGTAPNADAKRAKAVAGDIRLLISEVEGKPRALLYRPVLEGATEPVPFASPTRTVKFDQVEDISAAIELAADTTGNYEISVPLKLLGLNPVPGQSISGDIGILRGSNGNTTQRVYWNNKATAIVSDIPTQAELRPNLWGRWEFSQAAE